MDELLHQLEPALARYRRACDRGVTARAEVATLQSAVAAAEDRLRQANDEVNVAVDALLRSARTGIVIDGTTAALPTPHLSRRG